MIICHLAIDNFRGIKKLCWKPDQNAVCLIGPGDSSKSTILDAIEFALSPNWSLNLDDSDFYNMDVAEAIRIRVTVGGLPEKLLSDEKFGLMVRARNSEGKLLDEPEGEDDELLLTIQLKVDDNGKGVINFLQARSSSSMHILRTRILPGAG